MPTISIFYGIVIQMFWQEHGPPHFHALYAEYEALVDIKKLEIIRGHLPKQSVLDSVEAYFRACHQYGNADTAFYETTRELWTQGSKFSPIAGFEPDMPYFCLRVPTGGGKTWLAAKGRRAVDWSDKGTPTSPLIRKCWGSFVTPTYELRP